ncbi:hypothetical protein LWC33_25390 [Pseudonocardia sp. RS11V-5]|uniref:hypothetical protein n=1 Tax=Pseudonocardia terrae TaxID=2905831 RepID=UPI001E47E455|nr:hypothetical protein [Pseudonocardia terrae]MCE3554773.1 hypothetical protein [Pseudonocardia terrae]
MVSIPGSPGVLRVAAKEVLRQPSVLACALVDVESGLTLDAETADRARLDTEAVAAAQAEVIRAAQALAQVVRGAPAEVVVKQGTAVMHLIRLLPDPAGPGLVLAVLVVTPERNLRKVRRVLDRIDPAAFVPRRLRAAPAAAVSEVPPAPDEAAGSPAAVSADAVPVGPFPAAVAPGPAAPGTATAAPGAAAGPAPARPAPAGTTASPPAGRPVVPPVPAWAARSAGAPAAPVSVAPGPHGALLTVHGPNGSGPVGYGPNGSGPVGYGSNGSGPVGSDPVGAGPVGSGPVGARPAPARVPSTGRGPGAPDGRVPAPVTAVDLARLVPAGPEVRGRAAAASNGSSGPHGGTSAAVRGTDAAPAPGTRALNPDAAASDAAANGAGPGPDRSTPAPEPGVLATSPGGNDRPASTDRSAGPVAERSGTPSAAPGVDLAGLADRPGLSEVDWFSPVTPGSPPPLRRVVAEPEEPHAHVGLPHRS